MDFSCVCFMDIGKKPGGQVGGYIMSLPMKNNKIDFRFIVWSNSPKVFERKLSNGNCCRFKGTNCHSSQDSQAIGIKDGTYLQIDVDTVKRQIILTPVTREYIHSLRGRYKGKGLMKALMAGKRRENGVLV